MHIDVRRIVQNSSLKQAKIAAGQAGMMREVQNLTVLEITDMEDVGIDILQIQPGDLVLSAFFDIKNNVDKQCETILELERSGAAGLVLFYIGQVIEHIDPSVIALCNQLQFPLLCLDSGTSQTISYSLVMGEVAELLLRRNGVTEKLEIDIINALLQLHQRNEPLGAALAYIASAIQVSVAVMTPDLQILEQAGRFADELCRRMQEVAATDRGGPEDSIVVLAGRDNAPACYCRRVNIEDQLFLLTACANNPGEINRAQKHSLFHILSLTASLWTQDLMQLDGRQFISAVIRGDRDHADRMCSQGVINPSFVRGFFLTRGSLESTLIPMRRAVGSFAEMEGLSLLGGTHRQYCVLLLSAEFPCDFRPHLNHLAEDAAAHDLLIFVPVTGRKEEFYAALPAAVKLYPIAEAVFKSRVLIGKWELQQLEQCLSPAAETAWEPADAILAAVEGYDRKNNSSLWETLDKFLLTHGMNYKCTAEAMFVHHNTIQYRIRKVEELCQLNLSSPADLAAAYRAVILRRARELR